LRSRQAGWVGTWWTGPGDAGHKWDSLLSALWLSLEPPSGSPMTSNPWSLSQFLWPSKGVPSRSDPPRPKYPVKLSPTFAFPRFCVTLTFLVVYLQGTEIFPTQLRSTGSGFASTTSSAIGITGPYLVYLVRREPRPGLDWILKCGFIINFRAS